MSDIVEAKEVEALISGYLDNELDDAGHQTLDTWLAADRANQRRFLTAVMDHRALAQQLQAEQHPTVRRLRVRPERRRLWTSRALAAAALLMLALGGVLWMNAEPPGPRVVVAGVVTAKRLQQGERLVLNREPGGLLYDDGTRLDLHPLSEITCEDSPLGRRVLLSIGTLTAVVTHQPSDRPFVIATPVSTTTVLGTTLTVDTNGAEAEVAVSEGKVAVERTSDHAKVDIAAGQRGTVSAAVPLKVRTESEPIGRLLRVGAGQPAATLSDLPALQAGDVVELQPGSHRGAWRLDGTGTRLAPITIRGASGEPPVLDGEGLVLTGVGAVPRAVLQLQGGHWRVSHLSIINGHSGTNAAGIRLADVKTAEIRDCRIARCDQGVDVVADTVNITDCDIGFCGTPSNEGFGHDVNLLAEFATVLGCHLHDQLHGQSVRSACQHLVLKANRIVNAEDGEISIATGDHPIDVQLHANLVVSKRERKGNSMRFILTEGEGTGTLTLVHNTFVAESQWVTFIAPGNLAVQAEANIFSGSSRIALPGNFSGRRNWLPTGATAPMGFNLGFTGADPGFRSAQAGDYRLRPDSPCRGKAHDGTAESWVLGWEPAAEARPGSRFHSTPSPSNNLGAFGD